MEELRELVAGSAWMPHGQCYLWQPGVLWLNVSSDLLIAIAYFSLPAALIYFVIKRQDLAFKPLFVMFGVFILACGMTHVMGAITVWEPVYWTSGAVKAITALASLVTAAYVWLYLPSALALPSHEQLHRINRQLHDEVTTRSEAEQRFRALLESAPDAIVIVDNQGRITLVNSQVENWFGYTREELLEQDIETLVPERFRDGHIKDRNRYIGHPVVRPMGAGLELYGRRKDGSEFPVEISLSPLETNHGVLITSVIRDISARKQAEQDRQQVQLRYRDLVNNLPVGIYRTSDGSDEHFTEVNPALADILGMQNVETLLGQSLYEFFVNPGQRAMFMNKLDREGKVKSVEVELIRAEGKRFHAAITAVRKYDEHQGEYVDGIVEDISERKKDEQKIRVLNKSLKERSSRLEDINSELEAFSYSVSHDLRTPLRAIDGFSRILLRDYPGSLDDRGNELLERVRKAAQNMSTLIDDLLQLSRVTRAELRRESVDLSTISEEVVNALQQAEPERKVAIEIQPDLVAEGDPRLLKVVMDNLIGNAWKFSSLKEDAKVEVGMYRDARDRPVYFVKDNGAGFDMAYSDKLFGAFQRLHDASTYSGTGIGLATALRVIHKHGGTIWAEAEPDKGAVFCFSLGSGQYDER